MSSGKNYFLPHVKKASKSPKVSAYKKRSPKNHRNKLSVERKGTFTSNTPKFIFEHPNYKFKLSRLYSNKFPKNHGYSMFPENFLENKKLNLTLNRSVDSPKKNHYNLYLSEVAKSIVSPSTNVSISGNKKCMYKKPYKNEASSLSRPEPFNKRKTVLTKKANVGIQQNLRLSFYSSSSEDYL